MKIPKLLSSVFVCLSLLGISSALLLAQSTPASSLGSFDFNTSIGPVSTTLAGTLSLNVTSNLSIVGSRTEVNSEMGLKKTKKITEKAAIKYVTKDKKWEISGSVSDDHTWTIPYSQQLTNGLSYQFEIKYLFGHGPIFGK